MCASAAMAAATCPTARRRSDFRLRVEKAMAAFVWTKMGVESGESLAQIVTRKEEERQAGKGIFWWGIGNSLGLAVREYARAQGGNLPVVFSKMLGRAKSADTAPGAVWRWTQWEDEFGNAQDIPSHANVISRGFALKRRHYALVCESAVPLKLEPSGERFDPRQCRTPSGKLPGASQVTALLIGSASGHRSGAYEVSFRAKLVPPWAVRLSRPVFIDSGKE